MLVSATWLPQAQELALGQRRRTAHDCGDGKTLLVEHKEGGYSAWCHRCSDKGWHPHPQPSLAERIARLTAVRAAESAVQASMAPPSPTEFNPSLWPLAARVWLYKAGFSNDTIQSHGWYFAAGIDRVVLPVYQGGRVAYWQARGFDPSRPKYLNPAIDKPLASYGSSGPLVLTEDILSAARVGEAACGVAVLGTSLSDRAVSEVVRRSGGCVTIWLDPDVPGRKAARKIKLQLSMAGCHVRDIRTPLDPKLYSRSRIEELLRLT